MELRGRFRLLLGIQFTLALCLAILTAALFWNQQALSRAQQVQFKSYLLADELRQSSDDLTRLARAFVATGQAEFERQYWAVLDIRNGRIPRPLDYNRIYWDLVTENAPKPRPDGAAVSLRELMIREGFTTVELAKLATAQQSSNALVQTEKIALNAIKGLFDDGAGNFTVRRAPDQALAMKLLNDAAYYDHKARIMRPIDEFHGMFAQRTAGEVAKYEHRALMLLLALGATIVAILGLFVFSFVTLGRQLTERERAEAALRESEARIRVLGDNLPGGMIYQLDMGPDGKDRRFTYISAGVEKLHEVAAATVLEDAQVLYRQILPGDRPAIAAQEAEALAGMKPFTGEMRSQLPSGRMRWNLVTSAPRRAANGHIIWDGIELDITERQRARETLEKFNSELEARVQERTAELAARNSEIQALFDSIPDTVLLCDGNGALLSKHAPVEPAGLGGNTDDRAHEAIVRELAHEMHLRIRAGQQANIHEFDRTVNGSVVTIEARSAQAGSDRWLILLRDVSERKRFERGMAANLERERQFSEMKSQFITVASHEFRTPLAAAVGSLELLERHAARMTEAKRVELITRIQVSLSRLTDIMNDVLQLSRADSGEVKVNRVPVELGRFMQDLIREVETGDRQQHRFAFEQTGGAGVVAVDTKLVHHIVSNLIGNAVRYSPIATQVTVRLELSETEFRLTVADEGIGVPEAERERIFEPFVRGSNIGEIGGTGLGLNIVKRYTELMGGRIELLPTSRGAAFHLRIPVTHSTP